MGCASSKQFHDHGLHDELKIKPRKGSSSSLRRLVSSSSSKRREELDEEEERVVIANAERSSSLHLIPKTQNNHASIPVQSGEVENNKASTATEATGHHRRRRSRAHGTGIDDKVGNTNRINDEDVKEEGKLNSSLNSNPNLSLRGDVPNGAESEQVSAGWPRWLTDVAGEAVRGWVPRKAESFEKLDKIGQGTYSSVYRARDLETGKIVALKKVRFANMDPESVKFMAREIHILRRLDHPNVIKLEGLVTSRMSSSLYLVFEYMEHDLAGLAATPGLKFTEPQVKCYMHQLLSGLDHCHNRGVLHRDIKGANLLINNDGILKIADFGLATFFNPNQRQQLTSRVVTLWYRPPELLLGSTNYGPAVDLWSAGCILAELLAGKPIMPGRTEVEQLHKIFKLCGSPSEEFWASLKLSRAAIFKPQHPYRRCFNDTYRDFPPSALSLLDRLLAVEPKLRGTAASALQSEFFNTKPYACHPSELPKYPPSKEYDAKLRDEEARRQRAAASKVHDANTRRKQLPVPDAHAELQHRLVQVNPKSSSYKYTPKEDGASGFPIDPPGAVPENGFSHRAGPGIPHLAQTGRATSNLGRPSNGQMPRFNGPDLTFSGPIGVGARGGNVTRLDSMKESMNKHGSKTGSRFSSYTGGANGIMDYTSHLIERPSTSHRKDEPVPSKEPLVVNGAKKNRIHYSGPLVPPGGNLDEMLKEHDRHIQQAVRRARFDKSKVKGQLEKDQSEALLFATRNGRSDR
ncbi:hypothetical protein LUZ63_008934 [Rhynchospora breviuscula]|uniref:[RNA-polymerase]-subunit kinase n=1 Tax=Rhynchospora breviuscula TaxID=2022672 RepID=A0A9Q0CE32_9POAL|nr:hypothetical protein LUZ63_008934 [Rhynchospora breviuscula]